MSHAFSFSTKCFVNLEIFPKGIFENVFDEIYY